MNKNVCDKIFEEYQELKKEKNIFKPSVTGDKTLEVINPNLLDKRDSLKHILRENPELFSDEQIDELIGDDDQEISNMAGEESLRRR